MSYRVRYADVIVDLTKKLRPEVEHRRFAVCLDIILIGDKIQIYDPPSMEILINRVSNSIETFTIPNMDQLCYALVCFGHTSESSRDLLAKLLHILPSQLKFIALSPRKFVPLVYHLAVLGFHDHELIHNALRKDFLRALYNTKRCYPSEVFALDAFAKINLKGTYEGGNLDEKDNKILYERVIDIKCSNRRFYEPYKTLSRISEIFDGLQIPYQVGHALPHFETTG